MFFKISIFYLQLDWCDENWNPHEEKSQAYVFALVVTAHRVP